MIRAQGKRFLDACDNTCKSKSRTKMNPYRSIAEGKKKRLMIKTNVYLNNMFDYLKTFLAFWHLLCRSKQEHDRSYRLHWCLYVTTSCCRMFNYLKFFVVYNSIQLINFI